MRSDWRHNAAVTAALGVLALVAACGDNGDGSGDGGADTGRSPRDTGGQVAAGAKVQKPLKEPAAADLANFSCERTKKGAWTARGDITSSAKSTMRYTITVVTVQGDDQVVGEQIENFSVKPDETVSFKFPKFYRGQADLCMPRLQRVPS